MGILEFFVESSLFNPNDEYGRDSLYLCSPIEDSFGYTFFYEAKLINYDKLVSGRELEAKLGGVECQADTDCLFTGECMTKCEANRCTHRMTRPHLVNFCSFLDKFLLALGDMPERATSRLVPLVARCARLEAFHLSESLTYEKSSMPVTFEKHARVLERASFWNRTIEYSVLVEDLKRTLWELIRHVEDPKKKKQKE